MATLRLTVVQSKGKRFDEQRNAVAKCTNHDVQFWIEWCAQELIVSDAFDEHLWRCLCSSASICSVGHRQALHEHMYFAEKGDYLEFSAEFDTLEHLPPACLCPDINGLLGGIP